jgi:hypothetical protein
VRERLVEAKALERPGFSVLESTNLRALEQDLVPALARQPRTCHMQALRQVLTPTGLWNCPAHRGAEKGRVAGPAAYATDESSRATGRALASLLDRFDASHECREVACLYNAANWWIESAVETGDCGPDEPEREDAFL